MAQLTVRVQRREVRKGWFERAMGLFRKSLPVVKAGFPNGSASADNIRKAIWNEFGTRGGRSGGGWGGPVPERAFMRTAVHANRKKYQEAMRKSAAKILSGETNLNVVLNKLGLLVQDDIQGQILKNMPPPNSPVTIAMKGSSRTLIDKGEMKNAVTYKVGPQ